MKKRTKNQTTKTNTPQNPLNIIVLVLKYHVK